MHYYQFNIADYRKDTAHLTPVQHHIYRWLIDQYYLDEKPIKNDMPYLLRRLNLDESYRFDLEEVLQEFFSEAQSEDWQNRVARHTESLNSLPEYPELVEFWVHDRIVDDIKNYKDYLGKKSAAGKASAKARAAKSNTRSIPVKECSTNHKPLTNNHKPINNSNGRMKRPTLSECEAYFLEKGSDRVEAEKFFHHYESNGWKVGKNPMKSWRSSIANWLSRNQSSAYPVKSGSAAQQENNLRVIQNWRPDDAV